MLIAMCSNDVEFFYVFFCVTIYSCVSVLSVITADEDPQTAMFCNNCCQLAMMSYKNKTKTLSNHLRVMFNVLAHIQAQGVLF